MDLHDTLARDRQFVVALARGLEILSVFGAGEAALTNGQIAQRTGLPKATVSRLTHTLTRLGYLAGTNPKRAYRLGDAVIGLTHGFLTGLDICQQARPTMEDLAQSTGMEISLARRDRLSMVVIERVAVPGSRTYCVTVGSRLPIAATASGRAFLAAISESDREFLLSLLGERAADHLAQMRHGINRALADYRRSGFCVSIGEWDRTVTAVASPIFVPTGEVEAVLVGGVPSRFMPEHRLRTFVGPLFARTAAELTRRLTPQPICA